MNRRSIGWVIAGVCVTCATFCCVSGVEAQRGDGVSGGPRLLAVRTTADWCKVCQSSKERFAEVTRLTSSEPVLYVTLDHTDAQSSQQAGYMKAALGIRGALPAKGVRVGELHLIDAVSKTLISTMSLNRDADGMLSTIKGALQTAG